MNGTDLQTASAERYLQARRIATRDHIEALEDAIREGVTSGELVGDLDDGGTDKGNAKCEHYFGDGVYVRSLLIKAGDCVVGRLHLQARVCLILTGRCLFVDEFQERVVEAPWIGEFPAGSKTAVFAETDTQWVAVVGTDLKDPQEIFRTITAASHRELLE